MSVAISTAVERLLEGRLGHEAVEAEAEFQVR